MKKWNGHYEDYDFSDPSHSLETLKGIEKYTQSNVEHAKDTGDEKMMEYNLPKLMAVRKAIRILET